MQAELLTLEFPSVSVHAESVSVHAATDHLWISHENHLSSQQLVLCSFGR